jgi:hypothetical protein
MKTKSWIWLSVLTIVSCAFVAICALRDAPLLAATVVGLFILVWFGLVRKGIVLVLALAIATSSSTKAQEPALPYAVGAVVVVVGGVAVYKLVKFCQKRFPKDTNAPPEQASNGAAWTYAAMGSCYSPASMEQPTNRLVEISIETWEYTNGPAITPGCQSDCSACQWEALKAQANAK